MVSFFFYTVLNQNYTDMKKILTTLAALCLAASAALAQPGRQAWPDCVITPEFQLTLHGGEFNKEGRSYNFAPIFLIYPDTKVDQAGADALVRELGLGQVQDLVTAAVLVINPVGERYDAAADFETFKTVFGRTSGIGNTKVIGIGAGASFVNTVLAPQANHCIAGILTIGGSKYKLPKKGSYAGVPAYVAGKDAAKVAAPYVSMASAVACGAGEYVNPQEPLLKVVADNADGKSLSEIFSDAWDSVLSRNYRFNNISHTHYEGAQFGQYGTYELEPYLDCESLGIKRNIVEFSPNRTRPDDKWLWYEYWPEELMQSTEKASIPVMVLLHGNTNDPRTQAETSGFIQVAAQDKFLVVEMEWQGNAKYGTMQHDGIETVIGEILRRYPQLDPSRVYAQGLSAGSMTATALGITKSHVFAAVSGNNGGAGSISLLAQATQKHGQVVVPYCSVIGLADKVVPFYTAENYDHNGFYFSWKLYSVMDGIDFPETLDYSVDPLFGIALKDRGSISIPKGDGITIETGQLYKGDIPAIKIMAIRDYGHWNLQPAARYIWDYLKQFSRDQDTFQLRYTPAE